MSTLHPSSRMVDSEENLTEKLSMEHRSMRKGMDPTSGSKVVVGVVVGSGGSGGGIDFTNDGVKNLMVQGRSTESERVEFEETRRQLKIDLVRVQLVLKKVPNELLENVFSTS